MTRFPAALPIVALLVACGPGGPTLSEQYPGDWQEDRNDAIIEALTTNGVQNCESLRYKQNAMSPGEYRVRCETDGVWQAYTVWTDSNSISRPYPVDPELD